ncbi:MAG TPA: phage head-tail connector protein [Candidatus Acidoferrales bacterium]|nr:phage head-tail connector protein [Candidatus Acidoferrales bacterium]
MVDYCTISDVKPVLHIETEVTSEDAELADCVTSCSDKVKNLLKAADLEVPLEIPQGVKDATKFFAAWQYRRRRDPEGAQVFWYDAQEALNGYIAAEKSDDDEPYVGVV